MFNGHAFHLKILNFNLSVSEGLIESVDIICTPHLRPFLIFEGRWMWYECEFG
jgi:hypothetical protein